MSAVGPWSGAGGGASEWLGWDAEARSSAGRNVSPEAFMEELCTAAGGYGRFFRALMLQYFGWWVAVIAVPALFLDHHKCEVRQPYFAWLLYSVVVAAMLVMAVLLELSVVQRLGLLKAGELLGVCSDARWRLPLLCTVLWKIDSYTDVVFIFIARDCGSSLWWASFATFFFGVVFGQLLLNTCFACTDCDRELPSSFGFVLLDFKLVNSAVRHVLPFDPDASHLPVSKPVTLRASSHLITLGKLVGDVAQVSIQVLFLHNTKLPHGFVIFSVFAGVLHCSLSACLVLGDCVQDEWSTQPRARALQHGTALLREDGQELPSAQAMAAEPPHAGAASFAAADEAPWQPAWRPEPSALPPSSAARAEEEGAEDASWEPTWQPEPPQPRGGGGGGGSAAAEAPRPERIGAAAGAGGGEWCREMPDLL